MRMTTHALALLAAALLLAGCAAPEVGPSDEKRDALTLPVLM